MIKASAGNQKGFTLVELMMTGALLSLLSLSLYAVLNMANVIFHTNDVYSRLNTSAMQTLRSISKEIGETSPNTTPSRLNISTSGGNSTVRFQVPVDWDNDGDATSGTTNPAIEWGAYSLINEGENGTLNGWIRYSVSNNQLVRDVLDASLVQVAGSSKIIANNVQSFTVTKNSSKVTMTLTLQATDIYGQRGASRNVTATLSSATLLRNAVN